MKEYVLGLVTLFHPERFLGCSSTLLRELPHIIRYRSDRTKRVKTASAPFELQYLDDHAVVANGVEVRSYRDTLLRGREIVPLLFEPRLLRIPDEAPGRPKWRVEFRREWPAGDPTLTLEQLSMLRSSLSASDLRVKGIWVNPSIDPTWLNREWVNLVLGPCSQQSAMQFPDAILDVRHDPDHGMMIVLQL